MIGQAGDVTVNETTPAPCGWCGRLVRWAVPADHAEHAYGRCVGRKPPETADPPTPYAGRCSVLVLHWNDDLPGSEIRRLSRGWAAKISEKPVVAHVHINTYGTVETQPKET